jgi:hypothetical protein
VYALGQLIEVELSVDNKMQFVLFAGASGKTSEGVEESHPLTLGRNQP